MNEKPLGHKAYGSIPHLPGSRQSRDDVGANEGQYRMCCVKAKSKNDEVIVQEKIDGSCCAVARVGGKLVALGRAGWLAQSSKYEQHQLFADWVRNNEEQFLWIDDLCYLVGEWIAQAHGTRYLPSLGQPFFPFDYFVQRERTSFDFLRRQLETYTGLHMPPLIHRGDPISTEQVQRTLLQMGSRSSGALDPIEGAVWRVQRTVGDSTEVLFLAKWVRPDKVDGKYLPEVSGKEAIWNWRP